MLAVDGF